MRAMLWTLLLLLTAALFSGCGGNRSAATEPVPDGTPSVAQGIEAGNETSRPGDATTATPGAGEAAPEDAPSAGAVQLLAVNVGKGDALILRVGDYVCLIDTGKPWAMGQIRQGLERMGGDARLDAVFVTHTDEDHTGGLDWLAEGAANGAPGVGQWCASALFTGVKPEKHPVAKAAAACGAEARWLRRGDALPLGDTGATLRVLAPASLYTDKDDNNSLVMMLESDQGRILFTGDMELPEEAELLGYGDDLKCAVLKVANHGDDDTTSAAFARATEAQLALVSTDSREKPGTPDPGVVSRLQAAGATVLATQDAEFALLVTLSGGVARAEALDRGAPPPQGLTVSGVDASDDRIALYNGGDEIADLGGCYLYSDRGDELFAFPSGTTLAPGGTLVVGTLSSDGNCDLRWDEKKVIHRKKADVISLFDSWGRLLDSRDNGL